MAYDRRSDNRDDKGGRPIKRTRRKVCQFCVDRAEFIDYKDVVKLKKCLTERSKILPRRVTGCCAYHQRELTYAVKKARQIALIPYCAD
jgi:small subunit ribosomal protein S18